VLQRQTQTPAFWHIFIDDQSAKTLDALATTLIDEYARRETATIQSELAKGDIYMPNMKYEVGQTLVFPALDFIVGLVLETRPGQNPEHGPFSVMQVELEDGDTVREFAMDLQSSHKLSQVGGTSLLADDISPAN